MYILVRIKIYFFQLGKDRDVFGLVLHPEGDRNGHGFDLRKSGERSHGLSEIRVHDSRQSRRNGHFSRIDASQFDVLQRNGEFVVFYTWWTRLVFFRPSSYEINFEKIFIFFQKLSDDHVIIRKPNAVLDAYKSTTMCQYITSMARDAYVNTNEEWAKSPGFNDRIGKIFISTLLEHLCCVSPKINGSVRAQQKAGELMEGNDEDFKNSIWANLIGDLEKINLSLNQVGFNTYVHAVNMYNKNLFDSALTSTHDRIVFFHLFQIRTQYDILFSISNNATARAARRLIIEESVYKFMDLLSQNDAKLPLPARYNLLKWFRGAAPFDPQPLAKLSEEDRLTWTMEGAGQDDFFEKEFEFK